MYIHCPIIGNFFTILSKEYLGKLSPKILFNSFKSSITSSITIATSTYNNNKNNNMTLSRFVVYLQHTQNIKLNKLRILYATHVIPRSVLRFGHVRLLL